MESLNRPVLILVALGLVLAGVGLYRWLAAAKPQPAATLAAPGAADALGLPRLVELGAESCANCLAMEKVLTELRQRHAGRLQVQSINVLKQPEQATQWKVMVIPTQIFLDAQGQERFRHVGFISAQAVEERFRKLGLPLADETQGNNGPR